MSLLYDVFGKHELQTSSVNMTLQGHVPRTVLGF